MDAFETAATEIADLLRRRRSPVGKGSAWAAMVSQFRERGHCDFKVVEVIEDEIRKVLESMKVAELRQAWATSVSGAGDPEVAGIPAGELRRFLEPELLARVTEMAVEEAGRP